MPPHFEYRQADDPSLVLREKNERNFPTPCFARERGARLPHETASEGVLSASAG